MRCFATHLSYWACQRRYELIKLINLCECGKPLKVEYDLAAIRSVIRRDEFSSRSRGLWRWRELMPLPADQQPVTLGEGDTPLIESERLAHELRVARILIKDEAVNPTGSFKARGMTSAVTMARHLGAAKLAVPSAGNGGGALAAYAAAAGIPAYVFMPRDVPAANRLECELAGANVTLVDGLINDCGRIIAERKAAEGWFDVSTLKEPYRVEGKKTLGYEIAEQLGWRLPDVIIYPTGGGTGLIGMWKAFVELEQLGWIGSRRPRMVSVQASGCAPIVKAFEEGKRAAELWQNGNTVASGLRVPQAVADFLILQILRDSSGTAVSVSDEAMFAEIPRVGKSEGIFFCPEGAACVAALRRLIENGWIKARDEVVMFN